MKAWRIGKRPHPVFSGDGAMLLGARWNSPGKPVIHAASTLALATLEVLAHAQIGKAPPGLRVAEIDIPKSVDIEIVTPKDLPGWDDPDYAVSCGFGDRWLLEARTAALLVPSVLSPIEQNVVINPRHKSFSKIKSGTEIDFVPDVRLQKLFVSR